MSWKEAPIDAMILSLYYLQGFFKYEILRGKCGLGQFNLKDIHKNCQVDRDIVEFPNDVITPTEIIDRVKGNIQESIQQLTKDEATCQNQETPEENDQKSTSTTQRSLALSAIRDNKVHLHTSAKSFVVEGTKGDKYAVTLHPIKNPVSVRLWELPGILLQLSYRSAMKMARKKSVQFNTVAP